MKKILPFLVLALLVFVFFIRNPESKSGNMAPDFDATLIDGSDFSLSDLRGNYVLLDFWGSWCPPCRKDNPNLVALHNTFHGKKFKDADGFEIVTIALEKDDQRWKKAAEKDGFVWKHQIVRTARLVLTDPLAIKYNVSDVPSKFLIGPEGDILGVNMKRQEIETFLSAKIN